MKVVDGVLRVPAGTEIKDKAFMGREDIQSVIFEGEANIGKGAFKGCRGVTGVSIPSQFSIEALRASLPDLNPRVIRQPLAICASIEEASKPKNNLPKRIAFVVLLCQKRFEVMRERLELRNVPEEMFRNILKFYHIEYVPALICPLNSAELPLTEAEEAKVEEYNQLDGSLSKYKAILPS